MVKVLLDLSSDAGYKSGRFSKTLLEKSLEFVPSKRDSTFTFNLGLVLLLAEVNLISEEQVLKKRCIRDLWH